MLAGASYLDVFMIYGVSPSTIYDCFHQVSQWIIKSFSFPLVKALQNEDVDFFNDISKKFSEDSDRIFTGCIGVIDGMAVKIKCPTLTETLKNPGAYFCRKGYVCRK